jgi:hypothetical protein
MARPKTVIQGVKVNLFLPLATRRLLFALATRGGVSMSAEVDRLIKREDKRTKVAA